MDCAIYELKYCERCGALGTRRSETSDSYCEACARVLARTFAPVPLSRRRRPRQPLTRKAEVLPISGGVR